MTDKERLEEIKKLRETILEENNFLTRCVLANVFVSLGYIDYLIKQAERVHGKNNLIGLAGMYEDCNRMVADLTSQNKRYREALEYIQREMREAIYTPKNNKLNSDFEREFEKGKIRGLIQASDIVKKAIRKLEG